MKLKHITLLLVLAASIGVNAQTNVRPAEKNQCTRNGIIYYLPKSEIIITINSCLTISKPGPFFQYAERYFASENAIKAAQHRWSIESIAINTAPLPDPDKAYEVLLDKKWATNNIAVDNQGIIKAVNAQPNEQASEQARTTLCDDTIITFNLNVLNEEALQATSVSKMAEFAAKQVYRLREARTAILTFDLETMPDGHAIQAILERIDSEEAAIMELFTGKTVRYYSSTTYSVIPEKDVDNMVIARFSTTEGALQSNDVIGSPIFINIKGSYVKHKFASAKERDKYNKSIKGFFYNVPGSAIVTIYDSKRTYCSATFVMPQFGYTASLNPELTNNNTFKIIFNPNDGTIKEITR